LNHPLPLSPVSTHTRIINPICILFHPPKPPQPTEDEYSKFISDHGGHTNAFTAAEDTNYQFDVNADSLEAALDRFAQFFTCPLISGARLRGCVLHGGVVCCMGTLRAAWGHAPCMGVLHACGV